MKKQKKKSHKSRITRNYNIIVTSFFNPCDQSFFLMYAKPLPDEAYYWLWSKNLAFSYFDHPPLNAWAQAFISNFLNNNYFVIRVLPPLSLLVTMAIIIAWQQHKIGRFDYGECLKTVVLFLAFPIFAVFFSISFPDYLLITLLIASSFCLYLYFEKSNNERNRICFWYLAVTFFSLALLTKYNAVFLGIGALTYILYYKNRIQGPSYIHIFYHLSCVFDTNACFFMER